MASHTRSQTVGDSLLVAIDQGSSNGVTEGMEFLIARDGKFMGVLRISNVSPKGAAGYLTLRQGEITKGMIAVPK